MKLIIDIPEEVKQTFDNAKNEDLYGNYYDRNSLIGKAIQNGIPLDDLRNEIREMFKEPAAYIPNYEAYKRVLQIIDNYRGDADEVS